MAENVVTKDRIGKFIEKGLKIYASGDNEKRPADLFKQPSMVLLNASAKDHTIYAESAEDQKGVVEVSLDKPVEGGKIAQSTTKSSRDFNELAQTLRELGNVTWVMDKDEILRTFAMDTDPNKTKRKAFDKHFEQFSKDENNQLSKQLSGRDRQMLFDEVMKDQNNPFSLAIPSTTVEGNVGVINPADPDMPVHEMFFPYMKEKGIKLEEYNQFINTHEAGHANDRRNHRDMYSSRSDTGWKRHRTECVADTFATLMMAKKTGNTEIGRLAAEVRNEFSIQGLAYVSGFLEKQRVNELRFGDSLTPEPVLEGYAKEKKEELKALTALADKLGKYADKDFGKEGSYVGNPELKIFMEQSSGKTQLKRREPSFAETIINRFDGGFSYSGDSFYRSPEDVLGSIFAYTTTPTVDATIKVAEEKLKDGSLQKMTTKELYSLAEKMVDENTYSKNRLDVMIASFMKGEATPEVEGIMKRKENSDLVKTNKRASEGAMNSGERKAYDEEFKGKIKSDAASDVMDAVEKEKDVLREITPFESEYKHAHSKIKHLNKEYVEKKEKILANKNKFKSKKAIAKIVKDNKTR